MAVAIVHAPATGLVYLKTRPGTEEGEDLGPSSPAVDAADKASKKYTMGVLSTGMLRNWIPILQEVRQVDMRSFLRFYRLPEKRSPDVHELDEALLDLKADYIRSGKTWPFTAAMSVKQCQHEFDSLVELYQKELDSCRTHHRKALEKFAREHDERRPGESSDEDDPTMRKCERKMKKAEVVSTKADSLLKLSNEMRGRPQLDARRRPESQALVDVCKAMQGEYPHLPPLATTAWGLFGQPKFERPLTALEALHQIQTGIRTLELGSTVKVNEGKYLKMSFNRLLVHDGYKQVAHWEGVDATTGKHKEVYIAVHPWVYDAWAEIEHKLGQAHNDPSVMMSTYHAHYDQLDRAMRDGREPASTYLARLISGVRHLRTARTRTCPIVGTRADLRCARAAE